MNIPILRRGAQGERYRFTVSGLVGGHSGVEIDKGRASADILMGKALQEMLYADDSLRIVNVSGGLKDNAIPVKAEAEFVTKNADVLEKLVPELQVKVREEYGEKDPDITFSIASVDKENDEYTGIYPIDEMQNMQLIMLLSSAPFGVRTYSSDIEGLVQTSLNLGIMNTGADAVTITYSVRSSVEEEKQQLIDELETLARSVGGTVIVDGIYPAWEYRKESVVRDVMTELYEEMYGKPMIVEAIHAGLECGIFSGAISGLDAVSFGPDILDIHTPKERMNIDSVARTWDFVKEVLVRLC
jgi:dipeptidase D